MSKTIENLKSGNYEVVDNQGVPVTQHFLQCLEKEFADLEAKLAESEEKNKQLVKALNGEVFINYKLPMENAQLKQQLAEKEKMLERIMSGEYIPANIAEKSIKLHNQDKISFALEQLEKVKECFIEGYAVCKNFSDLYWNFTEQMDNQIAALTHQHEDKGE